MPNIRESAQSDWQDLQKLYPETFPEEDLFSLLKELLVEPEGILSLVAIKDDILVGHILFTDCTIEEHQTPVALLAPLAVSPGFQKQGIGSALIKAGMEFLKNKGVATVYVLGDPNYYSRSGFRQETKVVPPYDLPKEWATAWQSLAITDACKDQEGRLSVPAPWKKKELWLP